MRWGWIGLLSGLLTVLTACGGGAAPASAPRATGAPAPSAAEAARPAATIAPAQAAPAAPTKLKVAYSVVSGGIAPIWLASEQKLWERYGLDVDLTLISGTPIVMAALLAGEVQIGYTAGDSALSVQAKEPDVVAFVNTSGPALHRMMVGPGILRNEDLRGKRMGVFTIGDGNYALISKAMLKLNMDPNDVIWTPVGGGNFAGLVQALAAGAIDGTLLTPPNDLISRRNGAHELFRLRDLDLPSAGYPAHAMRKFLTEQPQVAEAYVSGIVDAVKLFKSDPALARQSLARNLQLSDDEAVDWTYNALREGDSMLDRPFLDPVQVRAVLESLLPEQPELRNVQLDRSLDNSVVEALDRKGLLPAR